MKTTETLGRATYSPEDNKLRFYPDARLSTEDYNRAKAHGFKWAPKQELFVAPMWTPDREDLLVEWCGEIEDEDKSLVERAEERAERFEDYSDKRKADADQAHAAVESICEHIPLGQPILVGHHSERRARKDAERIENGMRKAVACWEQSQYWKDRAKSAVRHAKYKELPDVRARRIKGIEAEKRRQERNKAEAESGLKFWRGEMKRRDGAPFEITEANRENIVKALGAVVGNTVGVSLPKKEGDKHDHASAYSCLSNSYPTLYVPRTVAEVQAHALTLFPHAIENCNRWLAHYENRLAYERAMLADGGGLEADQFEIKIGGRVLLNRRGGEWYVVAKLNGGTAGKPDSVSVFGYFRTIKREEIIDYRDPEPGDFEKVKKATKLPPLCNYPGERFATITQAEWDDIFSGYKGAKHIIDANEKHGRHRVRTCLGVFAKLPPPSGKELEPNYCNANRTHRYWPVFITDAKRTDPPRPDNESLPKTEAEVLQEFNRKFESEHMAELDAISYGRKFLELGEYDRCTVRNALRVQLGIELPEGGVVLPQPVSRPVEYKKPERTKFDDLKDTLKAGVQVVTAPQLFPTPPEIAARMAALADLRDGVCVLEPSAGTGNLVQAVRDVVDTEIVGIEINRDLCRALEKRFPSYVLNVRCADFLSLNGELGKFERILMNPPFANGADIKHIKHALEYLQPGGRLVAICANGPRQQAELQPLADSWEELPTDTFKEQGTSVRTALMTVNT